MTRSIPRAKILWLAAADARGHLMRAHLLERALAARDIRVEIVTTSDPGRAFLAALGTPSQLISARYRVRFDGSQNLRRARTELTILGYLLSPAFVGDLRRLAQLSADVDLVVNDFHPALLVSNAVRAPVVHVHGANLWSAVAHHFADGGRPGTDRLVSRALSALRARGFAVVEHTLDPTAWGASPDRHVLPPIVASPQRAPQAVRDELGVPAGRALVAVYLNPHFRQPALAESIERAADAAGLWLYAVGEGFATRPRWRAHSAAFVDVAAAANVLVSAPGMGALGLASMLGTPLLALATDQPEQRRNLRFLSALSSASTVVEIGAVARELPDALRRLSRAPRPSGDRRSAAAEVEKRWIDAFESLLCRARASARHHSSRPKWRISHA